MAHVVPFEDPTNYRRVERRVRALWDEGDVEIAPHAQKRMRERKLEMTDIQNVLRYGRVVEHSRPAELWRYAIEGKSVDGTKAKVVVEIDGSLVIVTVIS